MSQSAKPLLQATTHLPCVQVGVELAPVQFLSQAPQRVGSFSRSVSQPLAATPSQSEKPLSQISIAQLPAVSQAALALGKAQGSQLDSPQPCSGSVVTQLPVPHRFWSVPQGCPPLPPMPEPPLPASVPPVLESACVSSDTEKPSQSRLQPADEATSAASTQYRIATKTSSARSGCKGVRM